MARIKLSLEFSDTQVGHADIGFMPRTEAMRTDPETEDRAIVQFVRAARPELMARRPRAAHGYLYLDEVQ